MIFYIENTIDERHVTISGYFPTLEAAKEGLKECADWFRPKGTGTIYKVDFGLHKHPELVSREI